MNAREQTDVQVNESDLVRSEFGSVREVKSSVVNYLMSKGVVVHDDVFKTRFSQSAYEKLGKRVQMALPWEAYFNVMKMGGQQSTKNYYRYLNAENVYLEHVVSNCGLFDWWNVPFEDNEHLARNVVYESAVRFAGAVEPDKDVVVYGCGGGADAAIIAKTRLVMGHSGKVVAVDQLEDACLNTVRLIDTMQLPNCRVQRGDNYEIACEVAICNGYNGLGGVFSAWGMAGADCYDAVCRKTLELMREDGGVFGAVESPGGRFPKALYDDLRRRGMLLNEVMYMIEVRELEGRKYAVGKQMFEDFTSYMRRQGVMPFASGSGDLKKYDHVVGVVGNPTRTISELSDADVECCLSSFKHKLSASWRGDVRSQLDEILADFA